MRLHKNRKTVRYALVTVIVLCACGFLWVISDARVGWGSSNPGQHESGVAVISEQVAPQQGVSGVVSGDGFTLLIGQGEGYDGGFDGQSHAVDLGTLVSGAGQAPAPGGPAYQAAMGSSGPEYSYVSRLDAGGRPELVARIRAAVLPVVSADRHRVWLVTDLQWQKNASGQLDVSRQGAVFRSDDGGRTWAWQRSGLLAAAHVGPTSGPVTATPDGALWAWHIPYEIRYGLKHHEDKILKARLWVSPDGGQTSIPLDGSGALSEDWHSEAQNTRAFVEPLGPDRVGIWVSQTMADGSREPVTRSAIVTRHGGAWSIGPIQTRTGLAIQRMAAAAGGAIYAIASGSAVGADRYAATRPLMHVDPATLDLRAVGRLPNLFRPFSASAVVSRFWAGQRVMVLKVDQDLRLPSPRILFSGSHGRSIFDWNVISARAVLYSRDKGETWRRLRIRGDYTEDVLGLDGPRDRLYWYQPGGYDKVKLQVDDLATP